MALAFCLMLLMTAQGRARTLTWTGNGFPNTIWSQPNNWNPGYTPTTGDTLVFPAGFATVNDLVSLEVHSIQFTGNGSTYLSGNPVAVESDITAASNNGEARVGFDVTFSGGGGTFYTLGSSFLNVEDNVYLGNNLALNLYAFTTNILVQGSIQGAADVVKLGSADAYLEGTLANTYTGGTYVRGGQLHLAKAANVVAVSSHLSIGENTTTSGSLADENPGQYPPALNVTVGPYGVWQLGGQATVTNLWLANGGTLGWQYPGGSIHGTGILTLNCDVTVTGTNATEVYCTLYIGSQTRTFNVDYNDGQSGYVALGSVVGTGTAGIIKTGPGALYLRSPDDYAGPTLVEGGLLGVGNSTALGASAGANAGTTVSAGATIEFDSVNVAEPLTMNDGARIRYFGSNTLTGPITLNGGCYITGWHYGYYDIDLLQLDTVVSGTGSLGIGGGHVRLGGGSANTFSGGAVLGDDNLGTGFPVTLELAKPDNVVAIPGLVDVNNFYSPSTNAVVLRNLQNNGVEQVRLGHKAQWQLNGHVVAPKSLSFYNDGIVDTQGGQLQMTAGPGTNRFYVQAPPSNPSYTAQIFGTLSLQAPVNEIYTESGPTLEIAAVITGPGALQKAGPGTVLISGNDFNSYAGETFVKEGTMLLNKPLAATAIPSMVEVGAADGSTAGTLRNLNSYQIVGGIEVHSQGLYDVNGQVENTDFLTLDGNAEVQTGSGYLSLKTGAGITVNPGVNTTATINDHVFLDPGNHIISVGSGASLPSVRDLVINAAIGETAASASIQKEGGGFMQLSGNNTYTGATFVNRGKVFPTITGALGTTDGATYVTNDAAIVLDGGVSIGGELLVMGDTGSPSLIGGAGSNVWSGPITLAAANQIAATNILELYDIISGPGSLAKTGPGTLVLDGFGANVYTGATFVNEGTLGMRKAQLNTISVPHDVTVGGGPGGPTAILLNLNETAIGGRVTVNDTGIWNLNQWSSALGAESILPGPAITLNGAAQVKNGTVLFFNTQDITVNAGVNTLATMAAGCMSFYGVTNHILVSAGANQSKPEFVMSGEISDGLGANGIWKDGAGALRLTATNTYAGSTRLTQGSLFIDGFQPSSAITATAGTLGGSGTVGDVVLSGSASVSPGEGPGILVCSNFNASGSGMVRMELNGATAGSGYDQINTRGTVSLSGLTLNTSQAFNSAVGEQFTIINNDGSDAVSGTFAGLPEGKRLYIGKDLFQISYRGGTGNDVVLSHLVTPPPPILTIARAGTNTVRLLWATNDPQFNLQTCTNLTSFHWASALPAPVVNAGNNEVTNLAGSTAQFYRLANP